MERKDVVWKTLTFRPLPKAFKDFLVGISRLLALDKNGNRRIGSIGDDQGFVFVNPGVRWKLS